MNFEYTTLEDLKENIKRHIFENKEVFFIIKPIKKWCYVGVDSYNKEYCDSNNISILNLGYAGGTIVTSDKDLNFVIVTKTPDTLKPYQEAISKALKNLGVENTIDGNDILINGFKISGCAENQIEEFHLNYFQISFSVDFEAIKNVCNFTSNKIPKGINDFYNISREDLEGEVRKCLV